jgi:hypothetical protein
MLEGRKREVRRLFGAVGDEVMDLQRIAFGPLQLGDLAESAWRDLSAAELTAIYGAVGLAMPSLSGTGIRPDLPSGGAIRDPSLRDAAPATDNG